MNWTEVATSLVSAVVALSVVALVIRTLSPVAARKQLPAPTDEDGIRVRQNKDSWTLSRRTDWPTALEQTYVNTGEYRKGSPLVDLAMRVLLDGRPVEVHLNRLPGLVPFNVAEGQAEVTRFKSARTPSGRADGQPGGGPAGLLDGTGPGSGTAEPRSPGGDAAHRPRDAQGHSGRRDRGHHLCVHGRRRGVIGAAAAPVNALQS